MDCGFRSGPVPPWLKKWTGCTSMHSPMWNLDTGADTKCPAMEPMCQIMLYNQLRTSDTIHKWTVAPEVPSSTSVPSPLWNPDTGADTKCPRVWNQYVKSLFIIICHLLTPFTSEPWLQKWASSTPVPSLMWKPDTGADTECPARELMCQIMFYNQ